MSSIDIRLSNGDIKSLPLDMLLGHSDSFNLAKHISRRLDVSEPKNRTEAHLHLLQLVAALYQRVESLEREKMNRFACSRSVLSVKKIFGRYE